MIDGGIEIIKMCFVFIYRVSLVFLDFQAIQVEEDQRYTQYRSISSLI